jgi:hypothetical protein
MDRFAPIEIPAALPGAGRSHAKGKEKRHNIHPSRIFKLFGASCEEAIWPGLKAQNMTAGLSELNLQI